MEASGKRQQTLSWKDTRQLPAKDNNHEELPGSHSPTAGPSERKETRVLAEWQPTPGAGGDWSPTGPQRGLWHLCTISGYAAAPLLLPACSSKADSILWVPLFLPVGRKATTRMQVARQTHNAPHISYRKPGWASQGLHGAAAETGPWCQSQLARASPALLGLACPSVRAYEKRTPATLQQRSHEMLPAPYWFQAMPPGEGLRACAVLGPLPNCVHCSLKVLESASTGIKQAAIGLEEGEEKEERQSKAEQVSDRRQQAMLLYGSFASVTLISPPGLAKGPPPPPCSSSIEGEEAEQGAVRPRPPNLLWYKLTHPRQSWKESGKPSRTNFGGNSLLGGSSSS